MYGKPFHFFVVIINKNMKILDLIIAVLAILIYNLSFGSDKVRKATASRLKAIILDFDYVMATTGGRFFINSLVVLLLICSSVLGALNFSILLHENTPIWFCIIASALPVSSVLPMISIIYSRKSSTRN